MNSKSVVVSLHIAPGAALPMQTVSEVRAVAGRGLPGDRYFDGRELIPTILDRDVR